MSGQRQARNPILRPSSLSTGRYARMRTLLHPALIDTHACLDDDTFQADLPAALERAAAAARCRTLTWLTTAPTGPGAMLSRWSFTVLKARPVCCACPATTSTATDPYGR